MSGCGPCAKKKPTPQAVEEPIPVSPMPLLTRLANWMYRRWGS